jgi:hypothetical protein
MKSVGVSTAPSPALGSSLKHPALEKSTVTIGMTGMWYK